jgi:hypothetical protein
MKLMSKAPERLLLDTLMRGLPDPIEWTYTMLSKDSFVDDPLQVAAVRAALSVPR